MAGPQLQVDDRISFFLPSVSVNTILANMNNMNRTAKLLTYHLSLSIFKYLINGCHDPDDLTWFYVLLAS